MLRFTLRAGAALALATPTFGKPIAYADGTTAMAEYGAGTRERVTYLRLNGLVHRWNLEAAQANIYLWGGAGSATGNEFTGARVTGNAATIEMNVNGLVCAFCAQGIEKKLKKFPATAEVVVSLEHRLVAVALKDGQDISDSQLRKSLTDAGYTVKSIARTDRPIGEIRDQVKAAAP